MKLQAKIGDEKHQIEFSRKDGMVSAIIDGRVYEVEVSEPEPNVFSIKNGDRVIEAFVSPGAAAGGAFNVTIDRKAIDLTLIDPKRMRGAGVSDEQADGIAEIRTAMPGKVVKVLVEKGAEIEKGDGVLVVEAMKMQNELKSPKSGIVKDIRVAEGATVGAGDVLAIVE